MTRYTPRYTPTADEIISRLWQGAQPNEKLVTRLGITAIANVDGGGYTLPYGRCIKSIVYPYGDGTLPDLDELHMVADQVVAWLAAGEVVLVHCAAGWNRSGLLNGLVLIRRGMKGADAVKLIQSKRRNALGNAQFRAYLNNYESDPEGAQARLVEPFKFTVNPAYAPKPFTPVNRSIPWPALDDDEDDVIYNRTYEDVPVEDLLRGRKPALRGKSYLANLLSRYDASELVETDVD